MNNIILVVDIETTGFLNQGGKIVELGIVKLDLDTGKITPAYSSLIKEPGFDISHTKEPFGWIFKNSDLKFEEVKFAPSLESQREIIQGLFDEFEATAYNKEFDFSFLINRGFKINELPCPMLLATPIVNLPPNPGFKQPKWPKVEEAWEFFFGKTGYIEAHRGLDDAKHEAKIVFELYKRGNFKVPPKDITLYDIRNKQAESQRKNVVDDQEQKNESFVGKIDREDQIKLFPKRIGLNQKEWKWGFCNKNDIPVIDFKYEWASHFSEGLAPVKLYGKYGYIDITDNLIIPFLYEEVRLFTEGLAAVRLNWKYGFINKTGELQIPCIYNSVGIFSDGICPAQKKTEEYYQFGYLNNEGNPITEFKYDKAFSVIYGIGEVRQIDDWGNEKVGAIDSSGKEVVPVNFEEIVIRKNGYVTAKLNEKWGLFDNNGNQLIDFKYYHPVGDFSCGMAYVRVKGKFGIIDSLGNDITPIKYDGIQCIENGYAFVRLGSKFIKVDKLGNEYNL